MQQHLIKALTLLFFTLFFGANTMAFEFKCVHEADTAPKLDPTADAWFKQARAEAKQRIPNGQNVAQLYQKAVDKDHWKAMHNLADLYLRGGGVEKDTNAAVDLYMKMIELEVPLGYYDMSVMVQRGRGVVQSDKDAINLLLKASDLGNPQAQTRIGYMYVYNKKKPHEGLKYLKCAASQDYSDAAYKIASFHKNIVTNYPVAMHYYQKALSLGNRSSARVLERVFAEGQYGYKKDSAVAAVYSAIWTKLYDDPDARFPSLAKEHPLPPNLVQGYDADRKGWKPTGSPDDYQ